MPQYSVEALAEIVQGVVQGDSQLMISGVADLKTAESHQISFLANPKYAPVARNSRAGAILIGDKETASFASTQIRVASPSGAFAKIVALFAPEPVKFTPGIHPTAVISSDAIIGKDVHIGPHVVIESGVKIGDKTVIQAGSYIGLETTIGSECLIYPNVVCRERSVLGNRVILHSGVVIGSDGFGYEFQNGQFVKIPQTGYVQIDDDVEIGSNTTVDRGRFDKTWIQAGCKIDNLVMIAHNVVIGAHSIVVAQVGISGSTTLGKYVTLAGQVGTVGHIHIGDRATVTAKSGVSKDVPSGEVQGGHRARLLQESLKIEALTNRLPEFQERIRALEKELQEIKAKQKS